MTALAPAPELAPRLVRPDRPAGRPAAEESSLDHARQRVEQDDKGKWDVTVLRRQITARNGELEFPLDIGQDDPMYERLAPTPHAFGQVCARLGVPAAYVRKCPLVLQDQNLNYWLKASGQSRVGNRLEPGQEVDGEDFGQLNAASGRTKARSRKPAVEDESWLLRARHGTLRAALSESYSPLDNSLLIAVLAPALPAHYRVQWLAVEEESFHLRITDPTKTLALLPGDDFFAGVHVANSEVGLRCVSVDAVLYRLVCANGLVAQVKGKSLLRRRHVGIARPRLRAALEEAVSQAFRAVDELMGRLRYTAQVPVDKPDETIDRLARLWNLSEQTAEIAKAALLSEPGAHQHTAYGLVNAFTNAAQMLPDDRRYDLEVLAGRLAENPKRMLTLAPAEKRLVTAGDGLEDFTAHAVQAFGAEIAASLPRDVILGGRS